MPNQAMIGGNIRYPTLQGICDLFRTSIVTIRLTMQAGQERARAAARG